MSGEVLHFIHPDGAGSVAMPTGRPATEPGPHNLSNLYLLGQTRLCASARVANSATLGQGDVRIVTFSAPALDQAVPVLIAMNQSSIQNSKANFILLNPKSQIVTPGRGRGVRFLPATRCLVVGREAI